MQDHFPPKGPSKAASAVGLIPARLAGRFRTLRTESNPKEQGPKLILLLHESCEEEG